MSDESDSIETEEIVGIMTTQSGRNVVKRILDFTGVDTDVFNADPLMHAKNAGRRSVGVWLRDEIRSRAPDKYLLMVKEHIDE